MIVVSISGNVGTEQPSGGAVQGDCETPGADASERTPLPRLMLGQSHAANGRTASTTST